VAFELDKGRNRKEYLHDDALIAWERLKKKFEPLSASSMVKME
jgi:hypothetical protein